MDLPNNASQVSMLAKQGWGCLNVIECAEMEPTIGQTVLPVLVSVKARINGRATGAARSRAANASWNLVPSDANWSTCGVWILVAP